MSRNIRRITGFGISGLMIGIVLLLVIKNTRSTKESYTIPVVTETTMDTTGTPIGMAVKQSPVSLIIERDIPAKSEKSVELPTGSNIQNDTFKWSAQAGITSISGDSTREPLPGVQEEINLPTGEKSPGPLNNAIIDCRKVKFKIELTVQESCNNKATGSFTIHRESVSGGQPPYRFSINMSGFYDTLVFTTLFPGNYPVYMKDVNNCTGIAGVAQIGSVDCTYQAVFAPLKDETWTVPVETGKEGILQIFSKSGALVYSLKNIGDYIPVWDGETNTGQQLPMGLYQFEINYSDGTRFSGTVTILK